MNGRFVKDKIFFSAIRAAYSGLVPQGRYAVAAVFLEMPFNEVDVNAHPSKIEVRFKDSEAIRYFISSELKNALSSYGSNHPSSEAVDTFHIKTGLTYFWGKVHCFIQRCNKSFRINLNPDGAFWDGHEPSNDDINLRERSKCLSYCETHLSKLRFIYDKVRE